ncbi:solute carrier family 13 member 4-like [Neolamprologus brichardi]|uniref:solute carrier family 13 member 4-like n=1 Tax=Neolamprologus brichardi TaxID=32507 RepID=UPI001643ADF9|nr:solute carrier family 13 member 4-like [Neolamprologus brichardi]
MAMEKVFRYPDAKVINFGTWFIFSFPIAIIMLVLTWLWLHFLFLGCKKGYRTDATVSVLLGFLLFLIPARRPFSSSSCCKNSDDDSESDPLAPMITWKDFQRLMPWEIVILVGGGYALAAGCKVSGLSVWIGRQLEPMSGLPPWAVTLLACLLVSAVTEFASNPATLTVFLPILSALVRHILFHIATPVPH